MDSVARRGWFESEGQRVAGVGSVSSPVVVDGRTLGVVCVAAPLNRVVQSIGQDFGEATHRAAQQISVELGK